MITKNEVEKLSSLLLERMKTDLKIMWNDFVSDALKNETKQIESKNNFSDLQKTLQDLETTRGQLNVQLGENKKNLDVLRTQLAQLKQPHSSLIDPSEEKRIEDLLDTTQQQIKKLDDDLLDIDKQIRPTRTKIEIIQKEIVTVQTKYNQMFESIYKDNIEKFRAQLFLLEPNTLFGRLWAVHSWLSLSQSSYWNTSLSVEIIQGLIQKRFLQTIPTPAFEKNTTGGYSLKPLTQIMPFTEAECHAYWPRSEKIFKLDQSSSKIQIIPKPGYYHRFEMYVYFQKFPNYYSTNKNILVLNLVELKHYQSTLESDLGFSHRDLVLLNLGDEDQAQWVLMKKINNNSWMVYLPKEYQKNFESHFKSYLPSTLTLQMKVIDLDEYKQFYSSEAFLLDELWVYVLVSRLYPSCLSNSKEYSDYRHDMAPHVLKEMTFSLLKKYDSAFTDLNPYSTKYIQPLHHSLSDIYDNGVVQLAKMNDSATYNQLNIKKESISELNFFQCIELSVRLKLTRICFDALTISISVSHSLGNANDFIELLDWNPTVTEVTSNAKKIDDKWISELYFASARNRFLKANDPSYDDLSKRKELWNQAGFCMRDYLQETDFNLDFVNEVIEFNRQWHGLSIPCENDKVWKYVQIAQMGKRGLDVLFDKVLKEYEVNWKSLYQEPAPQLYALFDFQMSLSGRIEPYILALTNKIRNFDSKCAPLFKKIGLILSSSMSKSEQDAVINLLKVISIRKFQAPQEPDVIELYNVSKEFLSYIPKDLHISISIPAWDRQAIELEWMRNYRQLQNRLEVNIRSDHANRKLKNIPNGFDDYQNARFDASFLRQIREEEQELIWPKDDKKYPVITGEIGIQQQLQQQVMQEYQQEIQHQVQKQVQLEKEFQHAFGTYGAPEHHLITRDNIESKMRAYWNALPEAVRNRSGLKLSDDLSKLFNMFVGCSRKADYIIERIEIETLKKLMQHASECRLGVDYHHWAGFRVMRSKSDGAYILTYNEKIEKEDIAHQQKLKTGQKDCYFKVLQAPLPLEVFRGDYLQFATISKDVEAQLLCWYYLAKEDDDPNRKAFLDGKFGQNSLRLNSLKLAQDIQDDTSSMPKLSPENCVLVLKNWAIENIPHESFNEALFSDWTVSQLQAFGQLFNTYGQILKANDFSASSRAAAVTPEHIQAINLWLTLAYEVYAACPEYFNIWKNRILMPRENWSEVMEESEVIATLSCINTLKEKNNQLYNHLFWTMVDAHGNSVGPMRLSEVWYGFEKLIRYLEDSQIKFAHQSMVNYLLSVVDFNASQFLKRLFYTLQDVSKGYEGEKFQIDILENIDKIDWRESGLSMAIQQYKYRFWHSSLVLSDLEPLTKSIGHYLADFDFKLLESIEDKDFATYTLRFIAKNSNVTSQEFQNYVEFFKSKTFSNIFIYRLIMISIMMGKDTLEDIRRVPEPSIDISDWKTLNQKLPIDMTKPLSYELRFQDVVLLKQFLDNASHDIAVMEWIGINRAGFALHSMDIFKPDDQTLSKIDKLFKFFANDQLNQTAYTSFPWIIENDNPAILLNRSWHRKLTLLLRKIDLKHTTWLPSKVEIKALFDCDAEQKAIDMLQDWCTKGCGVNLETHTYRLLTSDEKKLILREHQLLPAFADDNAILFEKILDKMTIDKRLDVQKLKSFLMILKSIDCKRYYNELGLVLTVLNQTKHDLFYRIDTLSSCLSNLFDKEKFKSSPFPVQFLSQLVAFCEKNTNTPLLNHLPQLQHESTRFDAILRQFSQVIKSNMSYEIQKFLIQVAIQYPAKDQLFWNASECLRKIAKNSSPLQKQYLLKLQESMATETQLNDCLTFFNTILKLKSGTSALDEAFQMSVLKDNSFVKFENLTLTMIVQLTSERPILLEKDAYHKIEEKFNSWSLSEIKKLANYYLEGPRPHWTALQTLLDDEKIINSDEFIHSFESKIMPEGKRDYSVLSSDKDNLNRILKTIKYKKSSVLSDNLQKKYLNAVYYINQYSFSNQLHKLRFSEILSKIEHLRKQDEFYPNCELIACLREVIVRKTGKWLNHTQVLDLVYASEQKESFLQQIRTGEGKSIISCARVAYHALHGKNVDIFSSKPELPARDIKEFANVYKSLGLRHSLIKTNSPRKDYHDSIEDGKGAIHYSTIGQMFLFVIGVFWKGEAPIDLKSKNRVAYLDEADAATIKHNTELNYSDQDENSTVYNLDAWVYRITYDFYLEHQAEIEENQYISIHQHLKPLCDRLQKAFTTHAPENSRFFQKFILSDPSHPDDEERINHRILELLKLIMAARSAFGLKENIQFSCRHEMRLLSDDVEILTSFAKVMIDNQIVDGSTYCENVHQVLHTLLNKQAIHIGQLPNFFIEPSSEIVVSFIPEYCLKNYYHILEGVTGTAGGKDELDIYRDVFHIPHVIKLPPHAEIKSNYLPDIYAETFEQQVDEIFQLYMNYQIHPFLITCQDDNEVERIAKALQGRLDKAEFKLSKDLNDPKIPQFIVDTNKTGRSEEDVLPFVNLPGSITISARMGRGTDIKLLDKDKWLVQVGTNPEIPRIEKQRKGRQGRNGAMGITINIYNYDDIYKAYKSLEEKEGFRELYAFEKKHLQHKLQKHQILKKANKKNWENLLNNHDLKEKYLITRTVAIFVDRLKEKDELPRLLKNYLIAELCAQLLVLLAKERNKQKQDEIRNQWKVYRNKIEQSWKEHRQQYNEKFENAVREILFHSPYKFPDIKIKRHVTMHAVKDSGIQENLDAYIVFYQKYFEGWQNFAEKNDESDFSKWILTDHNNHLTALFNIFERLSRDFPHSKAQLPLKKLLVISKSSKSVVRPKNKFELKTALFEKLHSLTQRPHFYFILSADWQVIFEKLLDSKNPLVIDKGPLWLELFFDAIQDFRVPQNEQECQRLSRIFKMMLYIYFIAGIKDIQNLKQFTADLLPLIAFIDDAHLDKIEYLFTKNPNLTRRLIQESNRVDLQHIVETIKNRDKSRIKPFVYCWKKDFTPQEGAIHAIFNLMVSYDKSNIIPNIKPSVQFDFLSQHPGYSEMDLSQWIQLDFDLIKKLPPYVSLSYIGKELKGPNGKYPKEEFKRRVSGLAKYANTFNEFLLSRGVIGRLTSYQDPLHSESYDQWVSIFEQLDSTQGIRFFAACRDLKVSDKYLLALVDKPEWWDRLITCAKEIEKLSSSRAFFDDIISEKMGTDHAFDWMRFIHLCQIYPTLDTQWVEIFYTAYQNSEDSDSLFILEDLEKMAHPLTKIVEVIHLPFQLFREAYPSYRDELMLYVAYLSQGKLSSYDCNEFLNVWKEKRYQKDFLEFHVQTLAWIEGNEIFQKYYQDSLSEWNLQQLQRFRDACEMIRVRDEKALTFIKGYVKDEVVSLDKLKRYQELLDEVKGKDLTCFDDLKKLYVDEEKCDLNELKEYIRVIEIANYLSKNDDALKTFFSKNDEEVITLMRYLHHKLLDFLGEPFKVNCLKLFVSQTPDVVIDISSKHDTLIGNLKSVFIAVFDRMTQLMGIYQKPFKRANISGETSLSFAKYKAFYDSCWWTTNTQRQIQAQTFFTKLEENTKNHSQNPPDTDTDTDTDTDGYFLNMFDLIFNTQKEMLDSDLKANKKRWFSLLNSKGYSRLYDITHCAFTDVMKAYLQAVSKGLISRNTHIALQGKLLKQLQEVYILMLSSQLPQNHSLNIGLKTLEKNSITYVEDFKKVFASHDNIPMHLKHVYDSIVMFQRVLEKDAEFKYKGIKKGSMF